MPKPNLLILQRPIRLLSRNKIRKTLIFWALGAFSKTLKKKLSRFSIPRPKFKLKLVKKEKRRRKISVNSIASLQAMRL